VTQHQHTGGLRQRFYNKHSRHHGEVRKMTLKERLILRDRLKTYDPPGF